MISFEKKRAKIQRINLFRLGFFILFCSLLLTSLIFINGLFITLILAFILNFSLRPLVSFLTRLKIPRPIAVPLVFISIIGLITSLLVWSFPFLSNQLKILKAEFPRYTEKLAFLIENWQRQFETHFFSLDEINFSSQLEKLLSSFGTTFLQEVPSLLTQSFTVFLLAPFFAFFLIKNEQGLTRNLFPLVPNHIFEMILSLHHEINKQVGLFIRARLLEAILVGTLVGVGLSLIQFPFALLLGVFTSLTNLIPYLGPIIGSIPVFFVALVNDYESTQVLFIMGFIFFCHFLDAFLIVPLLLSRIVNLHPLTVVIIIIAGGQFMGVLGMIISIPLVNALKVSAMTVYHYISDNHYVSDNI